MGILVMNYIIIILDLKYIVIYNSVSEGKKIKKKDKFM